MDQSPSSRALRLRVPISKSYRGRRYHPYARVRPSFDTDMPLIIAAVETNMEQFAVDELEAFSNTCIELASEEARFLPSLTWRRLLWTAIGAAIVWRVIEHACGWCAKK